MHGSDTDAKAIFPTTLPTHLIRENIEKQIILWQAQRLMQIFEEICYRHQAIPLGVGHDLLSSDFFKGFRRF